MHRMHGRYGPSMYVINQAELPFSNIAREFVGDDHGGLGITFLVVDAPPGRGPSLHRHPYAEIFIVQEGEVTMTDGQSERVIRAGDVAVVGPGEPHAFTNTGDGPLRQIDIHLSSHFETEWL
jgi:mannose-6-phosphate isomerase-like protein (cupin superfamily)